VLHLEHVPIPCGHVVGTETRNEPRKGRVTRCEHFVFECDLTLLGCEVSLVVEADVSRGRTLVKTPQVVGRGIDPRTSRFSDRNPVKTVSDVGPAISRKTPGESDPFRPRCVFGGSPFFTLFRVRVGTLWARSLSNTKYWNAGPAGWGAPRIAPSGSRRTVETCHPRHPPEGEYQTDLSKRDSERAQPVVPAEGKKSGHEA
jgi:hypothetical protein